MEKILAITLLFLLILALLLHTSLNMPAQQQYKTYPSAQKFPLPPPNYQGMTLEKALAERRTIREFGSDEITLSELSQLLFSAQGITDKEKGFRTAPSAGALYPIEIYLAVNRVENLSKGIYHYNVREHSLELLKEGDFSKKLYAASNQQPVRDAAIVFIFTAVFERTKAKYGERGERYIYIEAGHISQNLLLEATSLNLASVPIGAFSEEQINSLLEINGKEESAIYINLVGRKKS
ncbi:MAG: SagB/ThcOx family dehydrogenase [Candidatus Micrarchaeia archaeon]